MRKISYLFVFTLFFIPQATAVKDGDDGEKAYAAALDAVLGLWDRYDVVAFGEEHGSKLNAELRARLVRHPGFADRVGIIVIESANALHQEILDRYIAGEEVQRSELVPVWRETGSKVWDSPIYESFLAAVREVNLGRPADKRIRVLAGDLPIDLEKAESGLDYLQYMDRGDFPLHIVDCRILRPGRKALLVYGSLHLYHGHWGSFVAALDEKYPGRIAVVESTERKPGRVAAMGAALGLGDHPAFVLIGRSKVADWDIFETLYGQPYGRAQSMGSAIDALVWLGALEDGIVKADPAIYSEPAYAAWRRKYERIRSEAAELFRRGDFEGYKEWSDYRCD